MAHPSFFGGAEQNKPFGPTDILGMSGSLRPNGSTHQPQQFPQHKRWVPLHHADCPLSQDRVKLTQTNASPPPVIFGEIIGHPEKSLSRTTDLAPLALRLFASPKHSEFRKTTARKFRIATIPTPLSCSPLCLPQAVASFGRVNRPRYFFIGHYQHTP